MKYLATGLACAILVLAGCAETRPTGSIQGKITLSGKAVATGKVVFRSPEGMGDDREGAIQGGEYKVENLPVGPQRVEVLDVKGITPKTPGNGQVVEVKPGSQTINLKLGS